MSELRPGTGGDHYIPYEERTGEESVVYFTRSLSAAGLRKLYEIICGERITGKVAVKLHTGEKNGPNIIPREWVKELLAADLPDATIVETNTYYEGDRYTTEQHLETLKLRELMRNCRFLTTADEAQKVLDHLEEFAYIAIRDPETRRKPGRPGNPIYDVNPLVFQEN